MCETIKIGDATAIICRGDHDMPDHVCDEKATVYGLANGERVILTENDRDYYDKNYQDIVFGSVGCSVCGRAAIDRAHYTGD